MDKLKSDSARIRQWLKDNGRKQSWLARQLEISDTAMSERLKKRSTLGIKRIARLMGVSYKNLIITDE